MRPRSSCIIEAKKESVSRKECSGQLYHVLRV